MPEGPEVYALSIALNRLELHSECFGKHLFYNGSDYTFGLNGRVCFDRATQTLSKIQSGYVPGDCVPCPSLDSIIQSHNSAPDWMSADPTSLKSWIQHLHKTRRTTAATLLDQRNIAGIGVAWGSEILHWAGIHPETPSKDVDPDRFLTALIETRDRIRDQYRDYIETLSKDDIPDFVNEWFRNLYEIREMRVYKKGLPVIVAGRQWWVSQ